MWAAGLYLVGGSIVALGVWILGFGNGQRSGRMNTALWAVAAGVLWPVLLLGAIEVAIIAGAVRCVRMAHFRVSPVETTGLDENEYVLAR